MGSLLVVDRGRLLPNVTPTFPVSILSCHLFSFCYQYTVLENHGNSLLSNVFLQFFQTLPFATGQALARGILDSLMSTTYFNASALRLIRSWVTGGATIELELALAEGAGLRGGYSTPDSLKRRDRFKMEKIDLKGSVFEYVHYLAYTVVKSHDKKSHFYTFSHLVTGGYSFGDLFGEASSKHGMLCVGLYRYVDNFEF